jgi:hypothetical protein
MKLKKIVTEMGVYILRNYKGFIIESYDMSQLGNSEECYQGRAYSIHSSMADYEAGKDAVNAAFRIDHLWEAKQYIDDLIDNAA